MDGDAIEFLRDLHEGDQVTLLDDDWFNVGETLVLVEVEPVPGSTQCLVRSGGGTRTVSRLSLRPA